MPEQNADAVPSPVASSMETTASVPAPAHASGRPWIAFIAIGAFIVAGVAYGFYKPGIPSGDVLLHQAYSVISTANTYSYDVMFSFPDFDARPGSSDRNTIALRGSIDTSKRDALKLTVHVDTNFFWDRERNSLVGDARMIGTEAYFKIDTLPQFIEDEVLSGRSCCSQFLSRWIHTSLRGSGGAMADQLSLQTFLLDNITGGYGNFFDENERATLKAKYDEASILKSLAVEVGDTIGGEGTYKVAFDLDREGIMRFITDNQQLLYGRTVSDGELEDVRQRLDAVHITGNMWVGKKSHQPRKIEFDVAPDNTTKVSMSASLSNINEPVDISTPSPVTEWKEIEQQIENENRDAYDVRNSNSARSAAVVTLLNAVNQYQIDNKGAIPAGISTAPKEICRTGAPSCSGLVDLSVLTNDSVYIMSLPVDPACSQAATCAPNGTGYTIVRTSSGRITVSAPHAELGQVIQVTR